MDPILIPLAPPPTIFESASGRRAHPTGTAPWAGFIARLDLTHWRVAAALAMLAQGFGALALHLVLTTLEVAVAACAHAYQMGLTRGPGKEG